MQNPTHLLYSLGLDDFFFDPYEFDDPSDLIQQGISHAQEGRMDEAHNSFLSAFDLCVTMESTDVDTVAAILIGLGSTYFFRGELDECLEAYRMLSEICPEAMRDPVVLEHLSCCG